MSLRYHRGGWEVRWRDASGRQGSRRFGSEDAARAFDEAIAGVSPSARRVETARHGQSGGVYSYPTADGLRWRFVYRRSDGTLSQCLRGSRKPSDSGSVILSSRRLAGSRSRKKEPIGSTKSDRFWSVEIGPRLSVVLRDQTARRAELASGDRGAAFLFVMPVRTIKRGQGRWESAGVARPLDRNTVSRDWHKQALEDAALRDMPCTPCGTQPPPRGSPPATR